MHDRSKDGRTSLALVMLALALVLPFAVALADSLVIDNSAKTVTPKLTFSSGVKIGGGTVAADGDIVWDGSDLKTRRGGTESGFGLLALDQTWSNTQTFTVGPVISVFTPLANGQIGYDGSTFLFRENGTNKIFAASNGTNTWSAVQTYTSQPIFNGVGQLFSGTFTPTVNGEIGWDGSNFLFREGGVNKSITSFTGDLNGNTLKDTSGAAVRVRDDDGLNVGNTAGTQTVSHTATGTNQETIEGEVIVKSDDGFAIQNAAGTEALKVRPLYVVTTNSAASTEMTRDNGATKYLTLASDTTHSYTIVITARATAGDNAGKAAMYKLEVVASNNSGTTALEGDALKTIIAEGVAGWDANVAADDGNDRLAVSVNGDAASTVKWVAHVQETVIQ